MLELRIRLAASLLVDAFGPHYNWQNPIFSLSDPGDSASPSTPPPSSHCFLGDDKEFTSASIHSFPHASADLVAYPAPVTNPFVRRRSFLSIHPTSKVAQDGLHHVFVRVSSAASELKSTILSVTPLPQPTFCLGQNVFPESPCWLHKLAHGR